MKQRKLKSGLLFFVWAFSLSSVELSLAGERLALLIGNQHYKNDKPLRNPLNDIQLLDKRLRKVRFEVTQVSDASREQLLSALRTFNQRIKPGDIAVVYFSGHGLQHDNDNWLLPVNADIKLANEISSQAFSSSQVLGYLEGAGTKILILDACRNNPFSTGMRGVGKGLGRQEVSQVNNTLIAFAAAPNQEAQDGNGKNSPYAEALAQAIIEPGLTIEQTFKAVRKSVREKTHGEQEPWYNASLEEDVYFTGEGGIRSDTDPVSSSVVEPDNSPLESAHSINPEPISTPSSTTNLDAMRKLIPAWAQPEITDKTLEYMKFVSETWPMGKGYESVEEMEMKEYSKTSILKNISSPVIPGIFRVEDDYGESLTIGLGAVFRKNSGQVPTTSFRNILSHEGQLFPLRVGNTEKVSVLLKLNVNNTTNNEICEQTIKVINQFDGSVVNNFPIQLKGKIFVLQIDLSCGHGHEYAFYSEDLKVMLPLHIPEYRNFLEDGSRVIKTESFKILN